MAHIDKDDFNANIVLLYNPEYSDKKIQKDKINKYDDVLI